MCFLTLQWRFSESLRLNPASQTSHRKFSNIPHSNSKCRFSADILVYAFGHCGHCSLPSSRISAFLARFAAELLCADGGGIALFNMTPPLLLAFFLRDRSFPRRSWATAGCRDGMSAGDSGGDAEE